MGETLFAGVDGGGSKTEIVLVDGDLRPLATVQTGPSNFLRVGLEASLKNIADGLAAVVDQAGASMSSVRMIYCGIAGTAHPKHRDELRAALTTALGTTLLRVETDARIALTGALGGRPGGIVISGTGSVAFARTATGREAIAGGWGPIMGDEGSGYWIARQGMASIVRSFDGRGPKTTMSKWLCDDFDICTAPDLKLFVYAPDATPAKISRLNRVVTEAAEHGDVPAQTILRKAGNELASCGRAALQKVDLAGGPASLSWAGGAFLSGRFLLDSFREWCAEMMPNVDLVDPEGSPAFGAARLARDAWTGESDSATATTQDGVRLG